MTKYIKLLCLENGGC